MKKIKVIFPINIIITPYDDGCGYYDILLTCTDAEGDETEFTICSATTDVEFYTAKCGVYCSIEDAENAFPGIFQDWGGSYGD